MKAFLSWLAIHLVLFVAFAFGVHTWLSASPTRVFIAVDSSFNMDGLWPTVMTRVDALGKKGRYKEFAVVTDKNRVHSWQGQPKLVSTRAYGPRQLDALADVARFPELNDADIKIVVTNEKTIPASLSDWKVVRP